MKRINKLFAFAPVVTCLVFCILVSLSADHLKADAEFSHQLKSRAEYIRKTHFSVEQLKTHRLRNNMTLIFLEARRHWDVLTPGVKTYFETLMQRPAGLDQIHNTAAGNFKLHYTNGGSNAVDQTDADANGGS